MPAPPPIQAPPPPVPLNQALPSEADLLEYWTNYTKLSDKQRQDEALKPTFPQYVWGGIPASLRPRLWALFPPHIHSTTLTLTNDKIPEHISSIADFTLSVVDDGLPLSITIDATAKTTLQDILTHDMVLFDRKAPPNGFLPLVCSLFSVKQTFTGILQTTELLGHIMKDVWSNADRYTLSHRWTIQASYALCHYARYWAEILDCAGLTPSDLLSFGLSWLPSLGAQHFSHEFVHRLVDIALFDPLGPVVLSGVLVGIIASLNLNDAFKQQLKANKEYSNLNNTTNETIKDNFLDLLLLLPSQPIILSTFQHGYTCYRIHAQRIIQETSKISWNALVTLQASFLQHSLVDTTLLSLPPPTLPIVSSLGPFQSLPCSRLPITLRDIYKLHTHINDINYTQFHHSYGTGGAGGGALQSSQIPITQSRTTQANGPAVLTANSLVITPVVDEQQQYQQSKYSQQHSQQQQQQQPQAVSSPTDIQTYFSYSGLENKEARQHYTHAIHHDMGTLLRLMMEADKAITDVTTTSSLDQSSSSSSPSALASAGTDIRLIKTQSVLRSLVTSLVSNADVILSEPLRLRLHSSVISDDNNNNKTKITSSSLSPPSSPTSKMTSSSTSTSSSSQYPATLSQRIIQQHPIIPHVSEYTPYEYIPLDIQYPSIYMEGYVLKLFYQYDNNKLINKSSRKIFYILLGPYLTEYTDCQSTQPYKNRTIDLRTRHILISTTDYIIEVTSRLDHMKRVCIFKVRDESTLRRWSAALTAASRLP